MLKLLKQSTAATIKLGPFVDATDGVTVEDGLTIAQADIRLSKNGGDISQSNNATGATHDELGYYDVPLDATDTGTLGRLKIMVSVSGALPVWDEYMVVPANVYDAFVGGTTKLDVNTATIANGAITAAAIASDAIDADALKADAVTEIQSGLATSAEITALDGKIDTIDGVVDEILTDTGTTIPGMLGEPVEGTITNDLLELANQIGLFRTALTNLEGVTVQNIVDAIVEEDVVTKHAVSNSVAAILKALYQAPTSPDAPTLEEIVNGVWEEDIVTQHTGVELDNSAAAKLRSLLSSIAGALTALVQIQGLEGFNTETDSLHNLSTRIPAALVDGKMSADAEVSTEGLATTDDTDAILAAINAIDTGSGSGDHAWTYGPVNVDGQPQADAIVQVYLDSGYTTRLYIGKTDDTGYVTFHTDLAEETQTYQTIDVPGLAREYDDEKVVYD
jgi:DNA-binding winged helix-turn-helix (wHTH) protein